MDFSSFGKFLVDYNIISTSAGVIVAYSAWDLIQSFVGDLSLPFLYYLYSSKNNINLTKFISCFLSFIIVLIITFLSIQYIMNYLTPPPETTTTTTTDSATSSTRIEKPSSF